MKDIYIFAGEGAVWQSDFLYVFTSLSAKEAITIVRMRGHDIHEVALEKCQSDSDWKFLILTA